MIRIDSFTAQTAATRVATAIENYIKAYEGPPWNEKYLCTACNANYGTDMMEPHCPACAETGAHVLLQPFWTKEGVRADFDREMSKQGAIGLIGSLEGTDYAVSWGYQHTVTEDTDRHLDAPGVSSKLWGSYFYLDEIAVAPCAQGKGLGSAIMNVMVRINSRQRMLLRTKHGSRMHRIAERAGGKIIAYISRERIIMVCPPLDVSNREEH